MSVIVYMHFASFVSHITLMCISKCHACMLCTYIVYACAFLLYEMIIYKINIHN